MNLFSRCVLFLGTSGSTYLLLYSPSGASLGFSFSPILAYLCFQASLYIFSIFFVSRHPQNDEKGFFYRKFDLGLLRVQNQAKIHITSATASASQCHDAELLEYCNSWLALQCPWLVLQRQLAASCFQLQQFQLHFIRFSPRSLFLIRIPVKHQN